MMHRLFNVGFIWLLTASVAVSHAAVTDLLVTAENQSFDPDTQVYEVSDEVEIYYKNMRINCDKATVNKKSGDYKASGNIVYRKGDLIWKGEDLTGNYQNDTMEFGVSKANFGEWFIRSESGKREKGVFVFDKAEFGSCEYLFSDPSHPHYHFKASTIEYFENDLLKAKHVWLKFGFMPAMYFPVVWYGKDKDHLGITVKLGYDNFWGWYAQTAKKTRFGNGIEMTNKVDFMSHHGVGFGNTTELEKPNRKTTFDAYYINDGTPPSRDEDYDRRYDIDNRRYRVALSHKQMFTDRLTLRARADKVSDVEFLEDWSNEEYADLRQPFSFADLTYHGDSFSLNLGTRFQVNDEYSVLQRLPEARLNIPRRQLGNSGIFYQGETEAGLLKMTWRDFDLDHSADKPDTPANQLPDLPDDYDTLRASTKNFLYYPLAAGSFGRFIPRAGFQAVWYDKTSENPVTRADIASWDQVNDIDNKSKGMVINSYDDDGGSKTQFAPELGFELRQKFFSTKSDVVVPMLHLNGFRHIVEPYLNYTYIPTPDQDNDHLYLFDENDRLTKQNFARLGVKQRFQTRNRKGIYTFASMEAYADYHFYKPDGFHHMGDFAVRTEVTPHKKVKFEHFLIYDLGEKEIARHSLSLSLGDPNTVQFFTGYTYVDDYDRRPFLSLGSSLDSGYAQSWMGRSYDRSHSVNWGARFRLTEKMNAKVSFTYDIDDNEFSNHQYIITRDLHCWTGAFGYNSDGGDDYEFMMMFTLKAHPSLKVGSDIY